MDLPLVLPYRQRTPKLLTTPTNLHQILGDGNCLFRALSYVITGRQVYHYLVRQKIVSHMRDIENLLRPHMNMSLNDYIQSTGMAQESVWGSDIEIFAASSLLSTDIYVYSNVGSNFTWNKFSKSMLDGSPPQNTCSIYIQHTSGVHYDVVLDVSLSTNSDTIMVSDLKRGSLGVDKQVLDKECANINQSLKRKISNACSSPVKKLLKNESKVYSRTEKKLPPKCPPNCEKVNISRVELGDTIQNSSHRDHKNSLGSEKYKENINKFHSSMIYNTVQCSVCHEAWPMKTIPKSCVNYICRRCKSDKQVPRKFSLENDMIPSGVPSHLQGLTQIEEMLIARAFPIMRVYVKPGGQRGYSGHCINLPQKVSELAQSLPHCPKNIPIIVVTMKGKDNSLKDVVVRKNKVEQALHWLIKHNPQYKNVLIDQKVLESLPSNGVPSNVSTIETLEDPDEIDSHDTDTILTGGDADYEKENSSFFAIVYQ